MTAPISFSGPFDFRLPQTPVGIHSLKEAELELQQFFTALQQVFLAVNQQSGIISIVAGEAIAFGSLVQFYSNSGILTARNANSGVGGTSSAVQPGSGFCYSPLGIANGKTGFIQLQRGIIQGLSGILPGQHYWLSATNGAVRTTPDTATGHIEQYVGIGLSVSTISYVAHPWIQH